MINNNIYVWLCALQAVTLIQGVQVDHAPGSHFEMAVFSALPLLKVRERYPLDGSVVQCNRRDLRLGGCRRMPYCYRLFCWC